MREMKDSGIEWIGEIPRGWELKRLKAILAERKENNIPVKSDLILSLGANYGIIPYSEKEGGGNKSKEDLTAYKLAYPNDIVMNSMNIISGAVGLSTYFGCVSPVYYVFYPRKNDVLCEYYYRIFQSKAFQRSLLGLGNGILIKESNNGNFNTVRMRIPIEKLNILELPVPPLPEQRRIADFLDRKCAEIDAVIEKTKAAVEEYKKLKQSVITEAVTKGVRSPRPMKPSGVEWIGDVPEGWEIRKIKYCFDIIAGATPKSEVSEYWDGDIVWITPADYKTEDKYVYQGKRNISAEGYNSCATTIIEENNIVFSKRAPIGSVAINAVPLCTNQGCMSCVNKGGSDILYFYYVLSAFTEIFNLLGSGTTFKEISADNFSNFAVPFPEMFEQQEISDYLDRKCAGIDNILAKKQQFIKELESYKKSLIYEYVTGKKEVKS